MTDDEMRIAIAEACGWKRKEVFENSFADPSRQVSRGEKWHNPDGTQLHLPDYPNDLNAMWEAEEEAKNNLMDADQWSAYAKAVENTTNDTLLVHSTVKSEQDLYYEAANLIHATARQRAEAFLKTLGKWVGP